MPKKTPFPLILTLYYKNSRRGHKVEISHYPAVNSSSIFQFFFYFGGGMLIGGEKPLNMTFYTMH